MERHSIAKVVIGRLIVGASSVLLLCDLARLSPSIKPQQSCNRMTFQAPLAVSLYLNMSTIVTGRDMDALSEMFVTRCRGFAPLALSLWFLALSVCFLAYLGLLSIM